MRASGQVGEGPPSLQRRTGQAWDGAVRENPVPQEDACTILVSCKRHHQPSVIYSPSGARRSRGQVGTRWRREIYMENAKRGQPRTVAGDSIDTAALAVR